MAGIRGLLPVLLVLGVIFGPDAYKALTNLGSSPVEVDADKGLSSGDRVHIAFCSS